jgi:hypothetical protein
MAARGNNKDIQDAWMSRIAPQREMARGSEIQRLKNQGITENSDAWTRALRRLDEGDTDAQNQALIHGTQEYGNEFQRGLSGNAQNFGQNLSSAGFTNQAQAQKFGQDAEGARLANAAEAQRFAQDLAAGQFTNQAQAQKFGQDLSGGQFTNQAQAQKFGQDMLGADFANQSNQQQFGQNAQLQSMLAALRGQQFGEQGAQAALTGNQRAAMLTEAQALRQSPLNDLRSLMGANPNNPAFQQFATAGNAGGTDYFGAGKAGYDAEVGNVNAANASKANTTKGLVSLAGTAMMVF